MSHMTPPEAANWIRSAALTNQNALQSVVAQIDQQLAEVQTWPNTPARGRTRDALNRARAAYCAALTRAQENVRLADNILMMFEAGAQPVPVDPITWSTGTW